MENKNKKRFSELLKENYTPVVKNTLRQLFTEIRNRTDLSVKDKRILIGTVRTATEYFIGCDNRTEGAFLMKQ